MCGRSVYNSMKICKSIAIAFSLYSKIPMPQFPWEEKEMRTMLCFFPWIGGVIGLILYGWYTFCDAYSIGEYCYLSIGMAIPLLITGGFHMDGFLDTMDALHSYQERERKLEILKDSHVGAFSIIMLVLYGLIYGGCFSEIHNPRMLAIFCSGFFLARSLSGLSVLFFSPAKKDGMLSFFSRSADKKFVGIFLVMQGGICALWMIMLHPAVGGLTVLSALLTFLYYARKTKKEFGGVTGDTSGYFVVLCEGVLCITVACCNHIF